MDTARNKEIARTFRRGSDQHRGLNFNKALLIKVITGDFCNLVAEKNIFHQFRAAKIKVAVFQTGRLGGGAVIDNFKRRCFRLAKNTKLNNGNLNFPRRDLQVF